MKRSLNVWFGPLKRMPGVLAALVLVLLLGGCSFSLAEDIKPPANYKAPAVEQPAVETQVAQQPADQPAAASTVFPLVAPDPTQGAVIFASKCAPCHGPTGMGDGPKAADLPNPPAPLGSPEFAHAAKPADWYRMVTEGNLEKFMPRFASLSDRQRWDVIAYALTLSTNPGELQEGKTLYEANCAACHGITGAGDGEKAASLSVKPAVWKDHERLVNLSAAEITQVMKGENEKHPAIEVKLEETQQYAVADYIRSLTFASPSQPGAAASSGGDASSGAVNPTPAAEQASIPSKITIKGQVTNASSGVLPKGLKVTISAYQGMTPAFDVNGDVKEDGTYEVKNVDYKQDYVYFAQVEANGSIFNSDILHATDITGETADLPLKIYDSTTDVSQLRADRLHIIFDFSQPGKIQVVNLLIISNLGDKVVVSSQPEQALLEFNLPKGAENLQFQDGELGGRYVKTENGFGDRMSIIPGSGQHQILYAYELPYDRKLALDVNVPLPVDAVTVMVPPGGLKVKSDQLDDAGSKEVQGMSFQMYQSNTGLEKGQDLKLGLSGKASATGAASGIGSISYLVIGLAGFALALIAGGVWLSRTQRAQALVAEEAVDAASVEPLEDESSEALLDAIVTLDDLHATGSLPETAYQERRADLKARLAEALKKEQ